MSKEANSLDTNLIKAIAIILVLVCHFGNLYTRITTPFGGIGVALFLFCSGYGLTKSAEKKGLNGFWKKRFINIWIPYIITQIVFRLIFLLSFLDTMLVGIYVI